MAQGGDITCQDGTGGESIYGLNFKDENFIHKHGGCGTLSMANAGPDTNGSQFFLTFGDTPHLDDKHVVFGKVIEGMEYVKQMEKFGSKTGDPTQQITIKDCGEIKMNNDDPVEKKA